MHKALEMVAEVDQSHPGLGQTLIALSIASRAGLCTLLVSPAGCGKSAICSSLAASVKPCVELGSLTRAGLGKFADEWTGYRGLIVVEDLSEIENPYLRKSTITTFSQLCYDGAIRKDTGLFHFQVTDFHGSAVIGVQPIILRGLVRQDEWDANMADKSLRFYHCLRPKRANTAPVELSFRPTIPIEQVEFVPENTKGWRLLLSMGLVQWSTARVQEHMSALLRSTAALDGRHRVDETDMDALALMLRPMVLERQILRRRGFESGRSLDTNMLHLVVEFATHGKISVEALQTDYKLAASTAYKLLDDASDWAELVSKSPAVFGPSTKMRQVLNALGYGGTNEQATTETL